MAQTTGIDFETKIILRRGSGRLDRTGQVRTFDFGQRARAARFAANLGGRVYRDRDFDGLTVYKAAIPAANVAAALEAIEALSVPGTLRLVRRLPR